MSNAVTDKGTTAMSALVVRPGKLSELVTTMEAIQSELYTDEVAEIANINSVSTRAATLVYFVPRAYLIVVHQLSSIVIPSRYQWHGRGCAICLQSSSGPQDCC